MSRNSYMSLQAPSLPSSFADPAAAEQLLTRANLPADDLEFVWETLGYGQDLDWNGAVKPDVITPEEYRLRCLSNIALLEHWQPGSAQDLYKNRGVYNFGRMPLRLLHHQSEPIVGRYRRAVWIGMMMLDGNAALTEIMACFDQALPYLPKDTCMVVDEFHHVEDIPERLERRAHEWSKDRDNTLAANVISLVGHGDQKSIYVCEWFGGRSNTVERLEQKHVEGDVGSAILKLAASDATVLYHACETGKGEDNLARTTFERTGLHVIAPHSPVCVCSVRIKSHGARLEVTPGFYTPHRQDDDIVYRRSHARHYFTD